MENKEFVERDGAFFIVNDDGAEVDSWKAGEEREIRRALNLTYTERFRLMMKLMRIGSMPSRAKITHKKML